MCDGIESMFYGLSSFYDKTNLIDSTYYWGYKNTTMQEWLLNNTDDSFWEYKEKWNTRSTQHPNDKGHKKICDELYKFLTKKINYII